jgi:hypothetical protein
MSLSKRVLLVVVCLFVLLFAVAAVASGGSTRLQPVGDEPGASGSANLKQTGWGDAWGYPYPMGTWNVRCAGLTPGATYQVWTNGPTATADRKGALAMQGTWLWSLPTWVPVYRLEPTGNVLVLSGNVRA